MAEPQTWKPFAVTEASLNVLLDRLGEANVHIEQAFTPNDSFSGRVLGLVTFFYDILDPYTTENDKKLAAPPAHVPIVSPASSACNALVNVLLSSDVPRGPLLGSLQAKLEAVDADLRRYVFVMEGGLCEANTAVAQAFPTPSPTADLQHVALTPCELGFATHHSLDLADQAPVTQGVGWPAAGLARVAQIMALYRSHDVPAATFAVVEGPPPPPTPARSAAQLYEYGPFLDAVWGAG